MKTEDVLSKALFLEESKPGFLEERVREILEAFGARQGIGRLQVQACWQDIVDRSGFRVSRPGSGFILIEARMLGLMDPAWVVGFSKEGVRGAGDAGSLIRSILVFVGTPMPSPKEQAFLRYLKSVLAEEAFGERLTHAGSRIDVKEALRMIDREVSIRSSFLDVSASPKSLAQLLVRVRGNDTGEEAIRSAIARAGATVKRIEHGSAPSGEHEDRITLSLERGRSLDDIVRAVGKVEGVLLRAITLLGPASNSRPA